MKRNVHTPVSLKFVSEKIRFKVLHYVQHDFIPQRPGFSKDQTSMFKRLGINYSILRLSSHFLMVLCKSDKYFFFIKVGAANVLLK